MASLSNEYPVAKVLDELHRGELAAFSKATLSESYLKELADHLRREGRLEQTVLLLISALTQEHSRAFDWNCGSLIQHAPPEQVFSTIPREGPDRISLYESIGLTWCLGEFGRRDQVVVDFIEDAVANAKSSESWWRAAHALEKLGLVDAVSYLKSALRSQGVPDLETCLGDLGNERYRIGILLHSKLENLQNKILPKAKDVLCGREGGALEQIGAAWIIGRFRYLDLEVENALRDLLYGETYEIRFYVLQAIREIASVFFLNDLVRLLDDDDPLLRKMAAQGLGKIDHSHAVEALRLRLKKEQLPDVLSAISQAIYDLTLYAHRQTMFIRRTIGANENGMITDEADKWYVNPDIYHVFSECQDPENLCFWLALSDLPSRDINDPVDIGSGTGRFAWYILENVPYRGVLHCLDSSEQMCRYLEQRRKRENVLPHRLKIHLGLIKDLQNMPGVGFESSDLIVANFAFPSRITDSANSRLELEAAYKCLRPGGYLVTVGWDETFNDELSEMWYKYVPDSIVSRNFEEWRLKRVSQISSPRNCNLTWFKRGLRAHLEFVSVDTAVKVMGYLFGRSAAEEILQSKRTHWSISLGITIDTKERLGGLLGSN